jgi:hypothetical protein
MKRAKQKRKTEQRFPITIPSIPIQTLHASRENYPAPRGVDYHFRENYKAIFLGPNRAAEIGMRSDRHFHIAGVV